MIPVEKSPFASRLTIVLDVLIEVASFTTEANLAIVEEFTPPILFTVAEAVTSEVPLNVGLV